MPSRRRHRSAVVATLTLAAGVLALPATAGPLDPLAATVSSTAPSLPADVISLVRVSTPTREDKDRLLTLGLDLTEHAGADFVEVVTHGVVDTDVLRDAGLSYEVEIPDLVARDRERARLDAAYAASVGRSPLPSGRDTYRTLADYEAELAALTAGNPGVVSRFALPEKTIEGRTVHGIEVTRDVAARDGKPVFLLMGLHHAREWPSGEHAMEFAHDLVNGLRAGDATITDLLSRARVVVVPVVNPDGFHHSRTSGSHVDLREVDEGGTVAILGTPGAAYKRKNCRPADGVDSIPTDSCAAQVSQGGFGGGVDLNRNYGGLWGGAGAAATPEDPTYRGAGPFSEPETRNVQALVSSKQVTTLITNHTFSNLVLRPPGVRAQGAPPDETAYEALGGRMAAQNAYLNQPSYALYDTTGTTEDWSYYATGGLGFTFEIGEEFHPPFERVVEHYLTGAPGSTGGGNRAAYLEALRSAADASLHSVLTGKAPAGAELTLAKQFSTITSPVVSVTGEAGDARAVPDRLSSSLVVGSSGRFSWHVNPSTRPAVMAKRLEVLGDPLQTQTFEGGPTAPAVSSTDHVFTATQAGALLQVDLTWPTPDDMDLEVYRREADGSLRQVASSGAFVGEKEQAVVEAPAAGEYVLRVINFASVSPTHTVTAAVYGTPEYETTPALVEQWTLTCRIAGQEVSRQLVTVDRGQSAKVAPCGGKR